MIAEPESMHCQEPRLLAVSRTVQVFVEPMAARAAPAGQVVPIAVRIVWAAFFAAGSTVFPVKSVGFSSNIA